jgi:DNA-binding MarR family transcriptional regulator/AraC-like DNA-binding protein
MTEIIVPLPINRPASLYEFDVHEEDIHKYMYNILNYNFDEINVFLMREQLITFINRNGFDKISEIVREHMKEKSAQVIKSFIDLIKDKSFNLNVFLDTYSKLSYCSSILDKIINFHSCFFNVNHCKVKSINNEILKYNDEINLKEYLLTIVIKDTSEDNFTNIINVLNIINELNIIMEPINIVKDLSYNEEFNEKILFMIHETFESSISFNEKINKIKKYTTVVNYYEDKTLFLMGYKKLLMDRILYKESDIKLEREIIKLFDCSNDNKHTERNKILNEIIMRIEDIEDSQDATERFPKIPYIVKPTSPYKFVNIEKVGFDKFKFKIFRDGFLKDDDHEKQIQPPVDLQPYFLCFSKMYLKFLHHERKFSYNFTKSISDITMTLNKKQYTFKCYLPQLFVLWLFRTNVELSVKDISNILCCKLSYLGHILKSLISARIIFRQKDVSPSDPNMLIRLNQEYTPEEENTYIDLTKNYDEIEYSKLMKEKNKHIQENIRIKDRQQLIKLRIVKTLKLKSTSKLTYDEIKTDVYENLESLFKKFEYEFNDDEFKQVLNECIKEYYLSVSNVDSIDYYSYFDDDDDEEEEDDE